MAMVDHRFDFVVNDRGIGTPYFRTMENHKWSARNPRSTRRANGHSPSFVRKIRAPPSVVRRSRQSPGKAGCPDERWQQHSALQAMRAGTGRPPTATLGSLPGCRRRDTTFADDRKLASKAGPEDCDAAELARWLDESPIDMQWFNLTSWKEPKNRRTCTKRIAEVPHTRAICDAFITQPDAKLRRHTFNT
ncbi:hypothetical protein FHS67_006162 [Aminobacter aminovorans]|jgi:hypothetical protein|uniref:Uncharacterized protein n=1 Tax=Aminobacter aminovorans TaxID=83263 RepID=A0AAC8YUY8_AMIAI|nr:hypothetical protein AA2016_6039 [Aminobacter aminovorans]MBB3709806.1 hypothetical protein [Aminobacter aminovorans]